MLILTYLLSNICVIVLRESRLLNYRPRFRSPFYPSNQIAGSCGFIILILEMGMETLLISMVLILSGLTFYWFYGRIKATREYALLHLLDRLTNKTLAGGHLISEKDPVEAFFLILTSKDKRDSYLNTLAILAQIAGDFSFEHTWRKAANEDRLRDIMLLTERKRVCSMPGTL